MNIPDSFMKNILSQLGQETLCAEFGQLKKALDDLLIRMPPRQAATACDYLAIRGQEDGSRQQAARMLAYSRFPVQFQIRSLGGDRQFLVAAPADRQQSLLTLLKTALPGLQAQPAAEDEALPLQSFARFSCLAQDPGREVVENWMDALAGLSLPGYWSVCLEAVPLNSEDGWIREQMQQAEELCAKLTALSGFTASVTRPMPAEAGTQAPKRQKAPDTAQFTASVQNQAACPDPSLFRARNTLQNLDTLLRDGGWKIRLCLRTQTREQQEILQSFLQAAFSAGGIPIHWKDEEDNWSVMTCRQLASMVSIPPAGYHNSLAASDAIPSEQLQKPFGILGKDRKVTAWLLNRILSGRTDLPFLMMDPDGDYCHGLTAQVYTLGTGTGLRVNPFRFPQGGNLTWHIHVLTDLLAQIWDIDRLHRAVLEQSITKCYVDLGWNLLSNTNYYGSILEEERLYPTFTHLAEELDAVSDRRHQDLALHVNRFLEGTAGSTLNHSCADALEELLSAGESAALDFSGLVNSAVKQVAMGSLLIQLAQTHNPEPHILVLADADLIPAMDTAHSPMEQVLDCITAGKAGPLFTSRRINCLPRYLPDAMDGCIVHRISGRDRGEDLLRFLRPGQGSVDLHTLDEEVALIRYGTMVCGTCFPVAQLQHAGAEQIPAAVSVLQPRELVRHLLDASADLDHLIRELMEPLYFQILLDQDPHNLTAALRENLFAPIRGALTHHAIVDMIRDTQPDTLVLQLAEQGFHTYIRRRSALGYCLQNLVEMYVFRILRLTVRGRALREADWKVLTDYRKTVLDPRYRGMILRSRSSLHERICRRAGIYPHSELLVQILADLYRYNPDNCTEAEISSLVQDLARQYLLKLPEDVQDSLIHPVYRCLREEE